MYCKICGKEIAGGYYAGGVCMGCFETNYWREIIEEKDKYIVAGHCCYCIGDEGGCSGRAFRIKMLNGNVVETNKLWVQGKIPERFWDELEDNAEYVKEI